jgi:ATP-dependent exoDNAse (exonuclease V) beta subunit
MNTFLELNRFSSITFHEKEHQYTIGGQKLVSVTTVISEFKESFDREGISKRAAEKRGVSVDEILKEWDIKKELACEKGTCFHAYAEQFLANKAYTYPVQSLRELFGKDPFEDVWPELVALFQTFYRDSSRNLVPVKSEVVIGDAELGIGGMIDQIYFNKKSGMLEIWDWKTNKVIAKKNDFHRTMLPPLEHLDECEWNTYSLQLALYKYIIEKNTNLRFGNSYLAWFREGNETYKIYKCAPFQKEIRDLLEFYKEKQLRESVS